MKNYNYKKINNCFVYGSVYDGLNFLIDDLKKKLPNRSSINDEIHPKEIERQARLKARNEALKSIYSALDVEIPSRKVKFYDGSRHETLENCVVIVCGDCCIGGKDADIYISILKKFNQALADNNVTVLLMRGEKDDPNIFNNELIDMTNVKVIPDYSVIQLKSFNCLCIGGSISVDREWKKKQEKIIGRQLYWENEAFKYDGNELNKILNEYDIACVITNTCPTFAFPGTNAFNDTSWALNDKSIKNDLLKERKSMDKVYEKIMETNKKPFVWFYSKFKLNNFNMINDIFFYSLAKQTLKSFNDIVLNKFGVKMGNKIKSNSFSLSIKEIEDKLSSLVEGNRIENNRIWDDDDDFPFPQNEEYAHN